MAGSGELFLDQVRTINQHDNIGILATPTYFKPQMSRDEANYAEWGEFRDRMNSIAVVRAHDAEVDYVITPKTAPWSMEDCNIFAGEEGRAIYEIDDFDETEGAAFLALNLVIADGLLSDQRSSAQVSIGFNAQDLSYNHHSVLKLHSHVRASPTEADLDRRVPTRWRALERFDRLGFIEPFSPIYHEYISQVLQNTALSDYVIGEPRAGVGYSSLLLARKVDPDTLFIGVKQLYAGMKQEYNEIADIFTDGSFDGNTGRPMPRPIDEREARLERFLMTRSEFYSQNATQILHHLATNLRPAQLREPDNPRDMSSVAKIYITRGFAGAMSFSLDKDADVIQFDFLPRVITTNPVIKTIMGEAFPTLIVRTEDPASSEEHEAIKNYQRSILDIVDNKLPSNLTVIERADI